MEAPFKFNIDMIGRVGHALILPEWAGEVSEDVRPHVRERVEFVCSDYGCDDEEFPGQYRWSPVHPHLYAFRWLPDAYLKFDVAPTRPFRASPPGQIEFEALNDLLRLPTTR